MLQINSPGGIISNVLLKSEQTSSTRLLSAEQSVISPRKMYGEPGYHLHLSAFVHLPHSFLTLGFFFQNLLELYAYLKGRWLDSSCLCDFPFSLTFMYCPWYSAVIQSSIEHKWVYAEKQLASNLGGLHVYSHCDSYQICSTYNCKNVFMLLALQKHSQIWKPTCVHFGLCIRASDFATDLAQSGFWLKSASFYFLLAPFLYKTLSRQSLWRWDPELWLWCSTLEKLWKRL